LWEEQSWQESSAPDGSRLSARGLKGPDGNE
jgi:hypothetical protein